MIRHPELICCLFFLSLHLLSFQVVSPARVCHGSVRLQCSASVRAVTGVEAVLFTINIACKQKL